MKILTSRLFGAILLVCGTTVGAGMLALPTVTSFGGFFPSLAFFAICWGVMLSTALFFLDVHLAQGGTENFLSLLTRILGIKGRILGWVLYLMLLYALIAAYIAGCSPLIANSFCILFGWELPSYITPFLLPLLFGGLLTTGTKGVDYANRVLMLGLCVSYALLIIFLPSKIEPPLLLHFDWSASIIALPVIITSFGYHIVIPSLATYLDCNRKKLRLALIIGSIIPLFIYAIWQILVLGVIPLPVLAQAFQKGDPASIPLAALTKLPIVELGAQFFSFFAIVTSFLGVALALSDFVTDGFHLKKNRRGRLISQVLTWGITFLPPLFFVLTWRRGFYIALEHAGALVAILLGIIPCWLAWKARPNFFYKSVSGRAVLTAVIAFCCWIVVLEGALQRGVYSDRLAAYISEEKRDGEISP